MKINRKKREKKQKRGKKRKKRRKRKRKERVTQIHHQINEIQREATAYYILCTKTGQIQAYPKLQKRAKGDIWEEGASKKQG